MWNQFWKETNMGMTEMKINNFAKWYPQSALYSLQYADSSSNLDLSLYWNLNYTVQCTLNEFAYFAWKTILKKGVVCKLDMGKWTLKTWNVFSNASQKYLT